MIRLVFRLLFSISILLVATPSLARAAGVTALPTAAETFNVGSIHVDRYGNGTRPLIFIPGLSCGPWVWASEISRYSKTHTVYALTLDGFDGQPFVTHDDPFATFVSDFYTLLQTHNIVAPVVIGHSLGGTLAFAVAQAHPQALAGFVALDGLPVFPTLAQATPQARAAAAQQLETTIAGETHDQLLSYETTYMGSATLQKEIVDQTAQLEAKSDPRAVAMWIAADLRADLRPGLASMTTPAIELMPWADPSPYTQQQTLALYQGIVNGAPHITVIPIAPARHFAMYDKPDAVDAAITEFIDSTSM